MVETLRERGARLDAPQRERLDVLLAHMEGELAFDLDKIMNTLVPDPVYHVWGGRFARDEVMIIRGRDAVSAMYAGLAAAPGGFPPAEIVIDRFVVGDDSIFFDGEMITLWPGVVLQAMGQEVEDPSAGYLETVRAGQLMVFEGGLMRGEELYCGPSHLVKLGPQ